MRTLTNRGNRVASSRALAALAMVVVALLTATSVAAARLPRTRTDAVVMFKSIAGPRLFGAPPVVARDKTARGPWTSHSGFPGPRYHCLWSRLPESTTCDAVGSSKLGGFVRIVRGVPRRAKRVPGADLQSIACAEVRAGSPATSCEAVGENSSQHAVVVRVANGTPGRAKLVEPQTYVLGSVACPSATLCYGIGADQGVVVPITNGAPGPAHLTNKPYRGFVAVFHLP